LLYGSEDQQYDFVDGWDPIPEDIVDSTALGTYLQLLKYIATIYDINY